MPTGLDLTERPPAPPPPPAPPGSGGPGGTPSPSGRRRARVVALVAVAVALVAAGAVYAATEGRDDSGELALCEAELDGARLPRTVVEQGLEPRFCEGFDADLDPATWARCYFDGAPDGCTNQWNDELEWYRPEQVAVDDGRLRLTAEDRPYTNEAGEEFRYRSGFVSTEPGFDFTYGYVEFAVDYPVGKGIWPAMWLLPADRTWPPEIDVLEIIGDEPDTAYTTVHAPDRDSMSWGTEVEGLSEGTHTFGVHWTAERIEWFIDGRSVFEVTDPEQIPDKAMYLVSNLAVGGRWPGAPDEATRFPAVFEIDHVRVWQ